MKTTRPRSALHLLWVLALTALTLAVAPPVAQAQQAPSGAGLVVLESSQSFEDTWSSLIGALDANSAIRTIAQVDHGAAASAAGLMLDNNRVVFFGNPALGTPLMQASRTTGIDLPQKMQVFEQDGQVYVAYNPPSYLAQRHQTGDVATLTTIGNALAGLAATATNTQGSASTASLPAPTAAAGLVTTPSANDFETTWSQLTAAIEGSPASVAFTVDHGENSGGSLPPTRLVVFGNPNIGTPFMASAPTSGVDLPLKILVYEDEDGITHVVSTSPSFVQKRHSAGAVATLDNASGAIANFTTAATTSTDPAPEPTETPDEAGEGAGAVEGQGDEVLGVNELAFTGSDADIAALAFLLIGLGSLTIATARRRPTF